MRTEGLTKSEDFEPLPVETGDEIFRNGIFEFNITKLLAFIKDSPAQFSIFQVKLVELADQGVDDLDEVTIQQANMSEPILLAEISPDRFNVIDGNHRLERARRDGRKDIFAYRVRAHQHLLFLTSRKAYEAYVDYWNSKIDDWRERIPCPRKKAGT